MTTQTEIRFPARHALEHASRVAAEVALRDRRAARREQQLRELASDLAEMVEAGELTSEQANEWMNDKADQWLGGDR